MANETESQHMKKMGRTTTVEIFNDRVRKIGPPDAIALEAAKSRLARQIGLDSGLFIVPKIIHHDEGNGVLIQERIRNFRNYQKLAAYGPSQLETWSDLGTALAEVHNSLKLCGSLNPLPDEHFSWSKDHTVGIHGDYNLVNLGYSDDPRKLVILDWSLSPSITGIADIGPSGFDLGWMIKSFFFLPCRYLFPVEIEAKVDKFLSGYTARANLDFCLPEVIEFANFAAKNTIELQARNKLKRFIYKSFYLRLRKYLHGVESLR